MTATVTAEATFDEPADLVAEGVHRDPTNHDPIASGTFTQRLVHRAAALFGGRTSRRSFLTKTAVVGSALAVGPLDFILKPGTAYGYLCGTCGDGWTAFCCTINGGRNTCPPGSFIAGWWKADNAAYCCGAARYIIDCNATCPTQCSCRCSGASCDGRKTCCNQFRYGQCNTQISCYGPVVCRVATCTPPWRYDPSCTTSSATDNRTRDHGAPCLPDCTPSTPISRKYEALGGAGGFLGRVVEAERALSDKRGRRARYEGGNIYWTSSTGAHEVHGAILDEYGRTGGSTGTLGYPTSDTRTSADEKARYSNFERGRIYYLGDAGTFTVANPFFTKHESLNGVYGVLGYPKGNARRSGDGNSTYQDFVKGRIYQQGSRVVEIHGSVFTFHEGIQGVYGPLGYPVSDLVPTGDGRGKTQWFQKGILWYTAAGGPHALWGKVLDRYVANGHINSYLRYPTSEPTPVGDGRGTFATFERGRIYASTTTGGFQVHGAVLDAYLGTYGGPTGSLGYPLSELDPAGTPGGRFQQFEVGRLRYNSDGTVTLFP